MARWELQNEPTGANAAREHDQARQRKTAVCARPFGAASPPAPARFKACVIAKFPDAGSHGCCLGLRFPGIADRYN